MKQVLSVHLVAGKITHCGCNRRKGHRHKLWRGHGDISGNFWDSIKRGALGNKGRRTPLLFEITIEEAWNLFIFQDKKCALSGLPLVINYSRKTGPPHTASLDRKNSAIGYITENIQWVQKDVNMMKNIYSVEYFIYMCDKISKNSVFTTPSGRETSSESLEYLNTRKLFLPKPTN